MGKQKKVAPLKSRTMAYKQIQNATLKFINQVKRQLRRLSWKDGMSDEDFIYKIADELQGHIWNDKQMLKILAEREAK